MAVDTSDGSGNLVFNAQSPNGFQVSPGSQWPCPQLGVTDAFGQSGLIGKIDSAGQRLLWGTWTGFSVPFGVVAVDRSGSVIAAGTDANLVVSALAPHAGPPRLEGTCIVEAGFPYLLGWLAPGEIFSIYNAGFGPQQGVGGPSGSSFGTTLGGVQVLIENVPAPLLYVSQAQINLVAPFMLDGRNAAHVKIVTPNGTSNTVVLGVQKTAPEMFEIPSNNPLFPPAAAILNQDGTVNSHDHPAHIGDYVAMFVSGTGQTDPPGVDGAIASAAGGTPLLTVAVRLQSFAPVNAKVTYAGNAPGLVSGVTQVNFQVPPLDRGGVGPPYSADIALEAGSPFPNNFGPVIWFE
jgi:uncharacterized protein (TIGR03437 family)